MANILDYVKTPKPYPEAVVFSPSKFSMFIDKPHQWYREQILEEQGFAGNTSSVIGTIVHYIAEMVAKDKPIDKEQINAYIDAKEVSEDYNPDTVRECYPEMAEALINGYVMERKSNFINTELNLFSELYSDYFLGGTLDVLEGSVDDAMITDYKTYNSKTKPRSIPSYYKYQLLVYVALCLAVGIKVNRIRLVYVNRPIVGEISEKTGKQLKSYPSEVTVLTEEVTEEDKEFIQSMLHLAVDSCDAAKEYPELTHIIFHDMRLKKEK
jgi:phenylpyruvate tautomerase PptA (4-oxalocrotonate tautomerase family)